MAYLLRTDTCEDYDLIKGLVNCLNVERANDYGSWLNVGFCLYNIKNHKQEIVTDLNKVKETVEKIRYARLTNHDTLLRGVGALRGPYSA